MSKNLNNKEGEVGYTSICNTIFKKENYSEEQKRVGQ